VRPAAEALQVVVGTIADQLSVENREALARQASTSATTSAAQAILADTTMRDHGSRRPDAA